MAEDSPELQHTQVCAHTWHSEGGELFLTVIWILNTRASYFQFILTLICKKCAKLTLEPLLPICPLALNCLCKQESSSTFTPSGEEEGQRRQSRREKPGCCLPSSTSSLDMMATHFSHTMRMSARYRSQAQRNMGSRMDWAMEHHSTHNTIQL